MTATRVLQRRGAARRRARDVGRRPTRRAAGLVGLLAAALLAGCSSSPAPRRSVSPQEAKAKIARAKHGGDPSAIHVFRRKNRSNHKCSKVPTFYATLHTSDAGRQLAADELAFFLTKWSPAQHCPAYLYVFHSKRKVGRSAYTAGAVIASDHLLQVVVGTAAAAPLIEIRY